MELFLCSCSVLAGFAFYSFLSLLVWDLFQLLGICNFCVPDESEDSKAVFRWSFFFLGCFCVGCLFLAANNPLNITGDYWLQQYRREYLYSWFILIGMQIPLIAAFFLQAFLELLCRVSPHADKFYYEVKAAILRRLRKKGLVE